jgi:hypothetical protein
MESLANYGEAGLIPVTSIPLRAKLIRHVDVVEQKFFRPR